MDIDTDEMFITLPKLDWKYIVKVIQQNIWPLNYTHAMRIKNSL